MSDPAPSVGELAEMVGDLSEMVLDLAGRVDDLEAALAAVIVPAAVDPITARFLSFRQRARAAERDVEVPWRKA